MKPVTYLSAVASCLLSASVFAAELDKQPVSDDFIAGFLAGAQMTDGEIIKRLNEEGEKRSDFFERAFKTRVGERSDSKPVTFYAGYCVPEHEAAGDVVENVKRAIEESAAGSHDVEGMLVYKALRSRYPC